MNLGNFPKADCCRFWILASTHVDQPKSTEKLNKAILLNLRLFWTFNYWTIGIISLLREHLLTSASFTHCLNWLNMHIMWKILFVTLLVAWYLHEPIPRGFSHPLTLRAFLGMTKTIMDITWVFEQLGLGSVVGVINWSLPKLKRTDPEFDHSRISETVFDGVGVRVYQPKIVDSDPDGQPALVFYHGGGWAISSAELYDDLIIPIIKGVGILVISVEYRMAPEHIFPIPFDDCLKATKHFLRNTNKYDVNPKRVAIGGDSAGGNLAAAIALKLKDDNFTPMPKLQLLVYPVLQGLDFSLPSMLQNGQGPLLTRYWLAYYLSMYATGSTKYASAIRNNQHTTAEVKQEMYTTFLNHHNVEMDFHYSPYKTPKLDYGDAGMWQELKDVFLNPYFSPLLANNVTGLPEAFVYTPQYDVLRDEGMLYARRLQNAGVPTTHVLGTNTLHGICNHSKLYPKEAISCIDAIVDFLAHKL